MKVYVTELEDGFAVGFSEDMPKNKWISINVCRHEGELEGHCEVGEKSAEMVLFPYHPPIETVVEFEERQHQGRFVRGEWIPAGVIPFTVERWIPINGRLTHVGLTHNATFFDGVRIQ